MSVTTSRLFSWVSLLSLGLAFSLAGSSLVLAETKAKAADSEEVEMFDAIKRGDIEVKLIPKDSTTGTVTIKNNTKKPLSIKLPDAFAGVPVNAQLGGFGGGGIGGQGGFGGGQGGLGGGQNQGFGGGFGGQGGGGFGGQGGGGFGGQGGGGGFFNVGPEKVQKLPIVAVCLEHGKKDPNPRVAYDIRPLDSVVSNPEVIEMVKMLGRGEIPQKPAQAAAWHLANGLSWGELEQKIGAKHINGTVDPYFTPGELEAALAITKEATDRAKAAGSSSPKTETVSPGEKAAQ